MSVRLLLHFTNGFQLPAHFLRFVKERRKVRRHILRLAFKQRRRFVECLKTLIRISQRRAARDRLDATNSSGDSCLADNLEHTDLSNVSDVRPAAKFHTETRHRDDADNVAVFLAKERHRPKLSGLFLLHLANINILPAQDNFID